MALTQFPSSLDWETVPFSQKVYQDAQALHGDTPLFAELLAQRISSIDERQDYLNPQLAHLSDPFLIPHLQEGVATIAHAIAHQKDILILGDYDVDGVSSVALLTRLLTHLGNSPKALIPHRQEDGYGLTPSILEKILAQSPYLLIAVDCGTNDIHCATRLKEAGIKRIFIDHHQLKAPTPPESHSH